MTERGTQSESLPTAPSFRRREPQLSAVEDLPADSARQIDRLVERTQAAFSAPAPLELRLERLDRLERVLTGHREALQAALAAGAGAPTRIAIQVPPPVRSLPATRSGRSGQWAPGGSQARSKRSSRLAASRSGQA